MSDNIILSCLNCFCGHQYASDNPYTHRLAIALSQELIKHGHINQPEIFASYMFLHESMPSLSDESTKVIHQYVREDAIKRRKVEGITQDAYRLPTESIQVLVTLVNSETRTVVKICDPIYRSFPLIFMPWIEDDDIFNRSKEEASITHTEGMVSDMSGLVNLVGRRILRGSNVQKAIHDSLRQPRLNREIEWYVRQFARIPESLKNENQSNIPIVLTVAFNCLVVAKSFSDAIRLGRSTNNPYCMPIIGILGSLIWPNEMEAIRNTFSDEKLKPIRDIANKVDKLWEKDR